MDNARIVVSATIKRRAGVPLKEGQKLKDAVTDLMAETLGSVKGLDEITTLDIHVNREALHKMGV